MTMNTGLLIDAIVRQTVVLIATLATASGQRGHVSHIADQVFSDLVLELKQQGLGNKVIADMFGLALRTYHSRVARLAESRTLGGRSLWEAVLGYVQQEGPVLRTDVLRRFASDDDGTVRSVLRDLVDSGLLSRSGRGDGMHLQAAGAAPESSAGAVEQLDQIESLVLVAVHRRGPIDRDELTTIVPLARSEQLTIVLDRLCSQGTVKLDDGRYSASSCVIDYDNAAGWEAAVFDHYQAMVSAMVEKLQGGTRRAAATDHVGGSTFTFDISDDHPMAGEVLAFLSSVRAQGSDLRRRVLECGTTAAPTAGNPMRVTAYVGQTVVAGESADDV